MKRQDCDYRSQQHTKNKGENTKQLLAPPRPALMLLQWLQGTGTTRCPSFKQPQEQEICSHAAFSSSTDSPAMVWKSTSDCFSTYLESLGEAFNEKGWPAASLQQSHTCHPVLLRTSSLCFSSGCCSQPCPTQGQLFLTFFFSTFYFQRTGLQNSTSM